MKKIFGISLLTLSLSATALAGVKVTSVDLRTNGGMGYVNIALDGRANDLPDVKIQGKIIEVVLANAEGFSAIFKNVRGAHLSANSLNGKAIVKAILPYDIPADNVEVGFKNSNIEVSFPRGNALAKTAVQESNVVAHQGSAVMPKEVKPSAPATNVKPKVEPTSAALDKKTENKVSKEILNEDYLNKLMKEENHQKPDVKAETPATTPVAVDEIKTKQASIIKTTPTTSQKSVVPKAASSSDNFSFAGYAAKFTVFLALVLGLFYGVVQLLKKGVFKKGKLGFLNNSQMIEVLSTTYIAPKRSLMVVKAHKQIFLVANSESGLTFLSEMNDTTGLIKEGEKLVTGTNFDINLNAADKLSEEETLVKLKENIMESTPINEEKGLAKIAVAKDIVKFSDELKKKAKKLKPIEFN